MEYLVNWEGVQRSSEPVTKEIKELSIIERRIQDGYYEYYEDYDDYSIVTDMDLEDYSGASEGDR